MIQMGILRAFFTGCGLFILQVSFAHGQFDELLRKLPPAANAIVMVNPKQIFASEVATRDGWKQRYDSTFADAPLMLPPDAEQFVLAADIDLPTMKPTWEAAVMRLAGDPSMDQVSRTVSGTRDTVSGLEAASTKRGAMIVKFAPRVFGVIQPGSRQSATRWVRGATAASAVNLSPYLKAQADVPDQVGTEIIMALDLTDALNRDRIRQALTNSEVLKTNAVNVAAATEAIAGIQGITLGARVTRRVYGVLKLDFASDTQSIAKVAKPLLLEVLDEAGASIDEFKTWNVTVTPKRISLEGELTASGLRRLFSFLELDSTTVSSEEGATAGSSSQSMSPDAAKSLQYYQSIQRCLTDLRHEDGASSYGTIALWFDKYARRIERQPILGVDKDLIDYGTFVVDHLRDAVAAIRGVGLRSGARSANVDVNYSGYYVFDSAMNYTSSAVGAVEAERRAVRQTERAQGSADARTLMREIEDKTSEVRRQMTQRYNIEFTAAPRSSPQQKSN
jgi:hypothetical protein